MVTSTFRSLLELDFEPQRAMGKEAYSPLPEEYVFDGITGVSLGRTLAEVKPPYLTNHISDEKQHEGARIYEPIDQSRDINVYQLAPNHPFAQSTNTALAPLAAYSVSPIANPQTPTQTDWYGWLDGLGRFNASPGATIQVGVYKGPTTTYNGVRVSAVSDQFYNNIREMYAEMNTFLAVDFNVQTFNSISATGSSLPIRIFDGKLNSSYAYAYGPGTSALNSDMFFNVNYDLTGSNTNYFRNGSGSHGWQSTWHETGHALGLNHTFSSGTPGQYDNWNYSTMTYTFSGGEAKSWMVGDLAYLQYLYGADSGYNSGNTNYVFSDVDSFTPYYDNGNNNNITGVAQQYSAFTNAVLYDAGGSDTCDFSGLQYGIRYDFDNITGTSSVCYLKDFLQTPYTAQNSSSTYYMTSQQTGVAYGTVIESVIGTNSSDQFLTVATRSETIDGRDQNDYVLLPGNISQYNILGVVNGYTQIQYNGGAVDLFKNIEYYCDSNGGVFTAGSSSFTQV